MNYRVVEGIACVQGFKNSLISVRIMMPSYSFAVADNAYFFRKEEEACFKVEKLKCPVC